MNQRTLEHCPLCTSNDLVVHKRPSRYAGQLVVVECRECYCSAPIDNWNSGRLAVPMQPSLMPHPHQVRQAH